MIPTKSERGNQDLQSPQFWCLSGLYLTRYGHSKIPNLTMRIYGRPESVWICLRQSIHFSVKDTVMMAS